MLHAPSIVIRIVAACAVAIASTVAHAQTWPARPIRIIVGAAPGGTIDLLARAVASRASESLGQSMVVENRPGASTNLSNEYVAKSAPDGHTLLMAGTSLATARHLYPKLAYDPLRDFAPITLVATSANVLVVNPALPARTVADVIALAKAKPGAYFYGTPAVGSTGHLAAEMFSTMAGIRLTQVPYKGAAPALADLVAGQIHMTFDNVPAAVNQIRAGKLRAIAVTSAERSSLLPDVPTIAESGLAGYEISAWFGIVAPAATPREIVTRLHNEVVKALASDELRERFRQLGFDAVGNTPEEYGRIIERYSERLGKVIRDAGMKVE